MRPTGPHTHSWLLKFPGAPGLPRLLTRPKWGLRMRQMITLVHTEDPLSRLCSLKNRGTDAHKDFVSLNARPPSVDSSFDVCSHRGF